MTPERFSQSDPQGEIQTVSYTHLTSLQVVSFSSELTDYPTQKPEGVLDRIITVSSNPGDLVLDCFIGSGTTAAVAQRLGRRWIGCDINKGAIQTTAKRLQTIIQEQIAARNNNGQSKLVDSEDAPPEPAQLSFTVWRVNDYDLQIQHNEAEMCIRDRPSPVLGEHLGRHAHQAGGY